MILVLASMLAVAMLATSLIPLLLFLRNRKLYRPPPVGPELIPPQISVLIPARDEADKIATTLQHVLTSTGVDLELLVLDDHSRDDTAAIVERFAASDARVRLLRAAPLPDGWCGKQHACHLLAQAASHPVLVFLDADVRLHEDALVRSAAFLRQSGAELVSGIPHQETGTFLEQVLIPLIHFLLLAYLPIHRMRRSLLPAFGAGCGQLFIANRSAYERSGGHAAIRSSRHDGIMLPRAFRRAGFATDLFDADAIATCRMYRSSKQVWSGLGKNATEGIGSRAGIVPWTLILLLGQTVPWIVLIWLVGRAILGGAPCRIAEGLMAASAISMSAGIAIRILCACRFRQSWVGVALHPLGVFLLLVVQWNALIRQMTGRPIAWKDRVDTGPSSV